MSVAPPSFRTVFVELRAVEGVAEAFVNGVPVAMAGSVSDEARGGSYLPSSDARPVQQHLVPGPNELRLTMRPGLADDGSRPPDGARARARVVRFTVGDTIDSDTHGDVLAEATIPPLGHTGGPPPQVVTLSFDPGFVGGSPLWASSPPVGLDDDHLDELERTIHQLADALRAGDEDAFSAQLEVHARDLVRAYPERSFTVIDEAHRAYARAFREGGTVTVAPRSAWRPRLVAGGRLVEPRLADGSGALVACPPEGEPVDLPLFVGWIDGRPTILR